MPNKIKGDSVMELEDIKKQLVKWIEELPFNNYDEKKCMKVNPTLGSITLKLFTENNEYIIYAKEGYLGCRAQTRKPRAGETHRRGNDLPDGLFNENTWTSILKAIIGYELVKIHKSIT